MDTGEKVHDENGGCWRIALFYPLYEELCMFCSISCCITCSSRPLVSGVQSVQLLPGSVEQVTLRFIGDSL